MTQTPRDPGEAHDVPAAVTAIEGEVVVLGPGMDASLTPDAAEETGRRLVSGSEVARVQAHEMKAAKVKGAEPASD